MAEIQNNTNLNQEGENELNLDELAKNYVSTLKSIQWEEKEEELKLFFELSYVKPEIFSVLGPLYEKLEMLEFSNFVFQFIASKVLDEPEIVYKDLLFIASRTVQSSPKFYENAVQFFYSAILCHVSDPNFLLAQKPFSDFIDFEPDATYASFQTVMKSSFSYLGKLLREGPNKYVSTEFLNLLFFWAPFASRFPNYQIAFCQICMQAIRLDSSLKYNPFRLKVLSILLTLQEFLPSISPLTHIIEKAFTEKCVPLQAENTNDSTIEEQTQEQTEDQPEIEKNSEEQNNNFSKDFSQVLIGNKDIARTEEYQIYLFDTSLEMLGECINGLCNRIAFPEISAPIIMCFQKLLTNQLYKKKINEIQSFLDILLEKSSWVQSQRKLLVKIASESEKDFDISSTIEVPNKQTKK